MASKKDNEKESLKETKTRKKKQEVNETIEALKEPDFETADIQNEISLSSLDLIWSHAFRELDEWVKRVENRDEAFLKEIIQFSDSVKRNQGNLKAVAEQFTREFAEWEKTARDEFLMSTTAMQHFFPIQSYEDINAQIDEIQKKAVSLLSTPCQTIGNFQAIEKYLEMIKQFMVLRKKGRMQYIKTVKQAGNLLYENQKGFVNFFARQIKALMFPLNKYMEKTEELIKS
ncbi:hypothetical protein PH210_02185 [Paenibacillus sp. BSR1-1]|uniref:hypothetical protein n=1 Tax=Paenibacillus sp. BSR1-1 TaxID=3020845 RepID=UPI0025B0797F|nr:hypothetical protein [Paenibacillus sp. BSR1-1]MDN3015011.1 hypothetical protein [Paenibacillus sp. BSR1-1]